MNNKRSRVIAFYLPQFHQIPENDKWWGTGFTEWTNVIKAKPLFKGHLQPRVPGQLGYYNLLDSEAREAQAELARNSGIEGFCYWHYWFGNGKRLLEKPLNKVIESRKPKFPICLGWANESWSGIWHGAAHKILIEQKYNGVDDYEQHFYDILPAISDDRYIKYNGKPLFIILKPRKLPDQNVFINYWNELAIKNGFNGIHFIGLTTTNQYFGWNYREMGFDAIILNEFSTAMDMLEKGSASAFNLRNVIRKKPHIFDFQCFSKYLIPDIVSEIDKYPCLYPNWDNTPRSGNRGVVLINSNPSAFKEQLLNAISLILTKPLEDRFIFIKSWNEWAEGNFLEPDLKFGTELLEQIKDCL